MDNQVLFDRVAAAVGANPDGTFSCPLPGHGKGMGDRNPSALLTIRPGSDGREWVHAECFAGCDWGELRNEVIVPHIDRGSGAGAGADANDGRGWPEWTGTWTYRFPQTINAPPVDALRWDNPGDAVRGMGCPVWKGKDALGNRVYCDNPEPHKHCLPGVNGIPKGGLRLKGLLVGVRIPGVLKHSGVQYAPAEFHPAVATPADDGCPVVVVCEGEKAADAVTDAGYCGVSSYGGAQKAGHADWSPLKGRDVILMPDHDDAGFEYADQAGRMLERAGGRVVGIVRFPDGTAPGYDAADLLADGGVDAVRSAVAGAVAYTVPATRKGRDLTDREIARSELTRDARNWVVGTGEYPKPIAGSVHNSILGLDDLGIADQFRWNDWTRRVERNGNEFDDKSELPSIRKSIEGIYAGGTDFAPTAEALHAAVVAVSQDKRYNPVVAKIRAQSWDGIDRLGTFGTVYLGVGADDVLGNLQAALLPRGMVVRALHPGAGFPYVPIMLSEKQGAGKFEILYTLAPGRYVEGLQMDGYDVQRKLQERGAGASVIELGEIDAIGGKNMSFAKSVATLVDTTNREAYAREASTRKLTAIVVGTTNNRYFLTDTEHRRNPVIEIPVGWNIPVGMLADNIPQIYAQCADEFDRGEWYESKTDNHVVRLPEWAWDAAIVRSSAHELVDPLLDWLADRFQVDHMGNGNGAIMQVASSQLQKDLADRDGGFQGTFANAQLGRAMQKLGYKSAPAWDIDNSGNKRRIRAWKRVPDNQRAQAQK